MINHETREQIHLLYAFGHFIANTDMHFGNLAFYFEDFKLQGLAPVYDMLPMFYMPVRDEVVQREYQLKPLIGIEIDMVNRANFMAKKYWQSILQCNSISHDFRKLIIPLNN
jgi:hypothetical protein